MRFNLRTILVGLLTASLTVNPAVACNYRGCGEVYVEPCGGGCGGPCEAVVAEDSCCSIGTSTDVPAMSGGTLSAPEPPSMPSPNMGGERLVPPQVPETHLRKPALLPPAVPTEPAAGPEQAPAETGADDLFGPSSDEPSDSDDMFGPADETAPAEESVEVIEEEATEPADSGDVDSLFGEPEAAPAEESEAVPAETPAAPAEDETEVDDLFSAPAAEDSAEPTESAEPAAPVEVVAPVEGAAPAEEKAPAEEGAPAEEEKKEEDSSFDDLFSNVDKLLSETGGLASTGLRRWVDNTGEFSCRGRLLDVRNGRAKLLKDNGRTTTVPLDRLSQADLQFVHSQASAQHAAADQTVLVSPARPSN